MRRSRTLHQILKLILIIAVLLVLTLLLNTLQLDIYSSELSSSKYSPINLSLLLQREKFLIVPKSLHQCDKGSIASKELQLLLIVPSSPNHHSARKAIRDGWGATLPHHWLLLFYLGKPSNYKNKEYLQNEASNYNDIIMDNFEDSYKNLTLKTMASLHWVLQHCPKVPYILKIDDDVLLNVKALQRLLNCIQYARAYTYGRYVSAAQPDDEWPLGLNANIVQQIENPVFPYCTPWNPFKLISYFINSETNEYESYVFGGYVYQQVPPLRNSNSKWYLSTHNYADRLLPPFLSGTSYILSTNLLPHLVKTAYKTPVIPLEDVYISGILGSKRLNLQLSHIKGWNNFRPHWESLCHLNTLVTVHGYQPTELFHLSKALAALNYTECKGYIISFTNWFNSLFFKWFPKYN